MTYIILIIILLKAKNSYITILYKVKQILLYYLINLYPSNLKNLHVSSFNIDELHLGVRDTATSGPSFLFVVL